MSSSIDKIKYLSWNADSLKSLIKYKLMENGKFTDQLFEDSNLSILIDIFAHTFECMTYMANIGASEAIFNDAILYENINRIAKVFGYNPRGLTPATLVAKLYVDTFTKTIPTGFTTADYSDYEQYVDVIIPKFTRIGSGDTTYSFTENYSLNLVKSSSTTPTYSLDDITEYPVLANGVFKLYPTVFSAQGIPFETFILDALPSLQDQRNSYVAHSGFYVYVQTPSGSDTTGWSEWKPVDSMMISGGSFNDAIFEVRLNENFIYELKFGDDVIGKRLQPGSLVYIVYLETYGLAGVAKQLLFQPLETSQSNKRKFDIDQPLKNEINYDNIQIENCSKAYTEIFAKTGINPNETNSAISIKDWMGMYSDDGIKFVIGVYNDLPSTDPIIAETSSEIKEAAPTWFRTGNRLVTATDFTNFVKHTYTEIIDVLTMNNFEYMSIFQLWLKRYDRLSIDVRRNDYPFADTCDFNNIYIWFKSAFQFNIDKLLNEASYYILKNMDKRLKLKIVKDTKKNKILTGEVVPIDAVMTGFTPCLKNPFIIPGYIPTDIITKKDITLNWFNDDGFFNRCKIYIYKNRNSIIPIDALKTQFINTIVDFFDPKNLKLGMVVDLNSLTNKLLNIDGINSIKTVYLTESVEEIYDGLSFAKWTVPLIDSQDFDIFSGSVKLEVFQFPFLINSNKLRDMIVMKSDNYMISEVTY